MAKSRERDTDFITTAAEAIGTTLGTIARKVDQFRGEHPEPIAEARAALTSGQKRLGELASDVSRRVAPAVAGTKAAVSRARKRARTARKAGERRIKKVAAKAVRPLKKATTRGRNRSGARKAAAKGHKRGKGK